MEGLPLQPLRKFVRTPSVTSSVVTLLPQSIQPAPTWRWRWEFGHKLMAWTPFAAVAARWAAPLESNYDSLKTASNTASKNLPSMKSESYFCSRSNSFRRVCNYVANKLILAAMQRGPFVPTLFSSDERKCNINLSFLMISNFLSCCMKCTTYFFTSLWMRELSACIAPSSRLHALQSALLDSEVILAGVGTMVLQSHMHEWRHSSCL